MKTLIKLRGETLASQQDEQAQAFQRLVDAWQQQQTFRAIPDAPWIVLGTGHGEIECTSCGSGGTPKVIQRQRETWLKSFAINQQLFSLTAADRSAVFAGVSHSLVLYGLCESLTLGIQVNVLSGLKPSHQYRQLQNHGTTLLYITPTQLRLLCRGAEGDNQVRIILCGGGKLDLTTRQLAQHCFPHAQILEFYGASETSFITLASADTPIGSVGPAYPGVEIEIRQAVNGIGEVWVRSPYLFNGYVEGQSAETRWQDDFMTVGELGYLDTQGNLWLAGRRSRMVTIADKNIYPESVEAVISQQLSQRLCSVVVKADALRGHALHACIEGPLDEALEKSLRHTIRQQLGADYVPRRFHFIDRFPLLATGGKIDYRALEASIL